MYLFLITFSGMFYACVHVCVLIYVQIHVCGVCIHMCACVGRSQNTTSDVTSQRLGVIYVSVCMFMCVSVDTCMKVTEEHMVSVFTFHLV